ncbi:hypothetical protein LY474_10840 [Myxococcus stipitatus]|uniref:hypothetical protein n=1 Tax=Myxococcus stipitatus TaxID=83455 RepID=UPI001F1F8ED8|nr:hypothetical protein [Myxococcus stipitatus]MCE9668308.1 hypothetical protein [Myxococcus stipitatus]
MPKNRGLRVWRALGGRWLCVLSLGLLLLPVGARAEPSPDVRKYLMSINRLIEDLEYERALEQISRAKKVSQGPEDDVAVSLYEGVVLAELSKGRQDEAEAAFKSALFLDPDAKLPLSVSPKLKRRFEEVRKKVRAELAARGESAAKEKKVDVPPLPPPSDTPPIRKEREDLLLEQPASLRSRAWIPAVAGGALAVTGGVFYGLAHGQKSKLRDRDASLDSPRAAEDVASKGKTLQTVGVSLLSVGVVGLGIATGMYVLGGPPEPSGSMTLQVGTDGTSAFISGRWP